MDKLKSINIGVGLGGCHFSRNLTNTLSGRNIQINISKEELDITGNCIVKEDKITIGKHSGAGKDRIMALNIFKSNKNIIKRIMGRIFSYLNEDDYRLITVSFTTGGGTGSGIGPALYQAIRNEVNKKGSYIVMGFPLLPNIYEGRYSMENTLMTLSDIEKSISMGGRFCMVENVSDDPDETMVEKTTETNLSGSKLFSDYIQSVSNSEGGVLDFSDKMRGLEQVGYHAFERFNGTKSFTINAKPTTNTPIEFLTGNVSESSASFIEYSVKKYQTIDSKIGYTTHKESILGYHGFDSSTFLFDKYKRRLDEIKQSKEKDSGSLKEADNSYLKDLHDSIVESRNGIYEVDDESDSVFDCFGF